MRSRLRPRALAQPPEEQEDLELHGHVERRRGLVGHEERRAAGEGEGDHRALAHAAGQLVGVRAEDAVGVGQLDHLAQLAGPGAGRPAAEPVVARQQEAELVADGEHRVERLPVGLEDHGDPAAPDPPHLGLGQGRQLPAVEADTAAADPARGAEQPQDGERRDALAAARLADEPDHLAAVDREIDAGQHPRDPARRRELHREAADLEQGRGHRRFGSSQS